MRIQLALVAGLLSISALAYGNDYDEDRGNRGPKGKTIIVTKYFTKVHNRVVTKTCTVTKVKNVVKTTTEVKTVTVTAGTGGKPAEEEEKEEDKEEEKEEEPVKAAEKPAKDEAADMEEGKEEPAMDEAKPAPKTHIIKAKTDEDGNDVFEPASLMAATGDTVVFEFHPSTHSVARGSFDKPCQPLTKDNGGFYSGFLRGGAKSPTFTVKVTDSNPIWYYCSVGKHCQGGMVGVINPGPKDDVKAYAAASKKASSNVSPAEVFGGTVFKPATKRSFYA
ncbi:hypothetical protein TWF718_005768 [Orbilia javanica]|uniref:Extracellular serine-rich protein n=1 Tax=Orbilia javanica TaxID=47235 RepID=A0AAN8RJN9_9PEZI